MKTCDIWSNKHQHESIWRPLNQYDEIQNHVIKIDKVTITTWLELFI